MEPKVGSKKITWEALDHIKEEKSSDWFWIVAIVAIGIAVLSIFFNNILFAVFIMLAVFTSFLVAHTAPRMLEYEINRKGIRIGEIIYPYSTLESFYVIDEDGFDRDRIILRSSKILMPFIIIPLGPDVSPDELREYLLEYLHEEEMEEPLSYKFMSRLGF